MSDPPIKVKREEADLTMVGPTAIASDCTSSASPFAVPSDVVPGVWSFVRIMIILSYIEAAPVSTSASAHILTPNVRTQ